ncbi:uncharacterized protein EV154DRAFT_268558 [Mucor mucedo]|uniref:uncharacterized protein n=1 Tax=Mucor mucedo TaxID=29922 RepID=UPI00221FDD2E|nr:uncharacterized protein EV154DRAFT_268558 [Mucor mucedo]KAI7889893.1 hypothetical protein EV154DRAFT_268558 [Mucor mucedo]
MSHSNSPHHHPAHTSEVRDPIMEDDHFSLRYGNPIQVIHDIAPHKIDTFEPSKEHVSGALAESFGEREKKKRVPLAKNSSSFLRDATLYSEYKHNKDGSITEIDHDK